MDKKFWIVWLGIVHHLIVAALLLMNEGVIHVSSVSSLAILGSAKEIAAVLISVAVLAIFGFFVKSNKAIFFILPQQVVLLLTAFGSVAIILGGHYADGVPRAISFIAADQVIYILVALFHSFRIVEFIYRK